MGEDAETGESVYAHRLDLLYIIVRSLRDCLRLISWDLRLCKTTFMKSCNRPDLVKRMSNYQVALRSCLTDLGMKGAGAPTHHTKRQQADLERVQKVMKDPERLRRARRSLSCISCYEKQLKSTIARLANREDGVTGHFGREGSNRFQLRTKLNC